MTRILTLGDLDKIANHFEATMRSKIFDQLRALRVEEGDTLNVTYTVSITIPPRGESLTINPGDTTANRPPVEDEMGRRHRRINLRDDFTG